MFLTNEEHIDYLKACIREEPKHAIIVTFGFYGGVTYDGRDTTTWGHQYKLGARDVLDSLVSVPDVRILIGRRHYRSCKDPESCYDCERQFARELFRLAAHADKFPSFSWRLTTELHLKCCLFFYPGTVRGGSRWPELHQFRMGGCDFPAGGPGHKAIVQAFCWPLGYW